jgi:hypothetical protein
LTLHGHPDFSFFGQMIVIPFYQKVLNLKDRLACLINKL